MVQMPAIIAGGITRPDMPDNIVTQYAAKATTRIRTTSKTYVPMGDMTITVAPEIDCGAIVMFSGAGEQYNELMAYAEMGVALYLDGVRKAETLLSPYAIMEMEGDERPVVYVARINATLIAAFPTLSAGSHTFQMYFKGAVDLIFSSGLAFKERAMQVILFYR